MSNQKISGKEFALLSCGIIVLIGCTFLSIEMRNKSMKQDIISYEKFNSKETVRQEVVSFEKEVNEDEFIWGINTESQPDILVYIKDDTNGIKLKSFPSQSTKIYKTLKSGETPYVIYDDYEYQNRITNIKLYLPLNSYHTILNTK